MKKHINVVSALFFILILCGSRIVARLKVLDTNPNNVKLLKTLEMRFCYISFVRIDGKDYIIKQKKSDCFRKIVGVVRDAVTAHIAESFGIGFAHQVDVIPAGVKFPGKIRTDWPATIHTIAPGGEIKGQNTPYKTMNIKQAEIGMRLDMLPWMMKHEALVKMVALDTFLCNHDRHRKNLFYNSRTKSFCAIDMDSSFKYNLSGLACKNFTKILQNPKIALNSKQLKVLQTYKEHLEFLIDEYPVQEILDKYDYFVEKAGFKKGTALYSKKIAFDIAHNKEIIQQNYRDVGRLVAILNAFIKKQKSLFNARKNQSFQNIFAQVIKMKKNGENPIKKA